MAVISKIQQNGSSKESAKERVETCLREQFPICLRETVRKFFGEGGKKTIDSIVLNESFGNIPVSSSDDVWSVYERFLERLDNILGENISEVIQVESIKEMKSVGCPLCDRAQQRLSNKKVG